MEIAQFETLCRRVWGAYEFLQTNDLSQKSGTSRRLRSGDRAKLKARLLEELAELRGVVEGTHFHEGFEQDIVLEGYEVWYWTVCVALSGGYTYAQFQPHQTIMRGYDALPPPPDRAALLPTFDSLIQRLAGANSQPDEEIINLQQVFWLLGQTCRLNATPPARLIERDEAEMRQKDYLAPYWQQSLINNI